jgi:hypothetical protein
MSLHPGIMALTLLSIGSLSRLQPRCTSRPNDDPRLMTAARRAAYTVSIDTFAV